MSARAALLAGAILGGLGVMAGAFGAHALRARLAPADLAVFETAVRYQLYHALALIGVALWQDRLPGPELAWAGRLFVAGIVVFSGTLYALVLSGQRWLGAVTPLGGVALIAGWAALALAALRLPARS